MSGFKLIDSRDTQVGDINVLGRYSFYLICGFVMTPTRRLLVMEDGSFLALYFRLKQQDVQWLLNGANEPELSIMDSLKLMFANSVMTDYLDELRFVDSLDEKNLSEMARVAAQHQTASSGGQMGFPAVFSPRRKVWVPLSFGRPK